MLLEGIEIDDTVADTLMTAFGAEPADFADPERRREAIGLLLLHGLELLEREAAEPTGNSDQRRSLETSLLALAGAPRAIAPEADVRGVPYQVWLPSTGWVPLAAPPDGWRELESALSTAHEVLATHSSLRTMATGRRRMTNEPLTEVVFAEVATPLAVEVRLEGRLFRFRLEPSSVLVSGVPLGDPEAVPEHR